MKLIADSIKVSGMFRNYSPRQITPLVAFRFLFQFPREVRGDIVNILKGVRYFSNEQVLTLVKTEVVKSIESFLLARIPAANIIVAPANMVGTSSNFVFEGVREAIGSEFPGVQFHLNGPSEARKFTSLKNGAAVIFLDDFVGTGDQFLKSFRAWSDALGGRGARFVLIAAVACEEGKEKIEDKGALVQAPVIHTRGERLWQYCHENVGEDQMKRFAVLACELRTTQPFGHRNGGSMVVLSRNRPNNVSILFRGTDGQRIWYGLFPRSDQLVAKPFEEAVKRVDWSKSMRPAMFEL
ncbi:MAG TPA: hypothetical protein VG944_03905 [Fimbriimonas sp.]|nr:hypothetical protein [Fimbriimonas sp.]